LKKKAEKKKSGEVASKRTGRRANAESVPGPAVNRNDRLKSDTTRNSKPKSAPSTDSAGESRMTGKRVIADSAETPTGNKNSAQSNKDRSGKPTRSKTASSTATDRQPNAKTRTNDGRPPREADEMDDTPFSSATSRGTIKFPEERQTLPKTHLTAKQLREFKELLLQKRAELLGDVENLTDEALNRNMEGRGDNSSMPIHMADLGSDTWEQDFTLGLIANEQAVVREIDDALGRIADKTYGVCLATHREIGLARLRATPWAKYCIEYARAREEGRSL